MKLTYYREASEEYAQAAEFLEGRSPGLGAEFIAEIEQTEKRILEGPDHWPKIEQDIRRCLVNRFPYSLLYGLKNNVVTVVAVMHQSRQPGYWHKRLK